LQRDVKKVAAAARGIKHGDGRKFLLKRRELFPLLPVGDDVRRLILGLGFLPGF
jgi:hypothetical protein